ncbi:serine/threonine-protein kinase [Bradyrhizobium genosp. A]|uniref:serine/threonine-protein kinase n=1 Tax=Bradyrhizobium genosp. A TaxID=83626 RepID=UPI003CF90931
MRPQDPYRPAHHGVAPGTRLNGIYEIDRMIGVGGMGEVYKGHEIQTGTAVAIKMLVPDMAENEAALALFRREASALHYLMHDAIVRYFVFTVEPTLQRPYLAMEYVDGRSLADLLEEGPLTLEALLRLTKRVASGLKAAHERGIIHRDVSPDNIIIPQNDVARAKIIDFGIARSTQLGDATIIGSGFAGKHNYVSPEQIGLFGGEINAQSDVYSLGLVLFYALTGQKLDMGGTQFQLVEKRRKVPDLGAIDARIRPLFEQMLQPDPKDRPTMADVENWTVGSAPSIMSSKRAARELARDGQSRFGQSWMRYGAIALAVLVVVGGGTAAYRYYPFGLRTQQQSSNSTQPSKNDLTPIRPPIITPSPSDVAKEPTSRPQIDTPGRSELARRYLQQYDGGDCFFIMPVAVGTSAAVVEGFGASTAPFDALDRSFKKSQGFEASIGIRLVTPPQCPAITFLNKVRGDAARAPRISLGSVKIRPSETLTGNIENFANRVVELLLISEDGQVQNISYYLKPGTDALSFSIEMKRAEDSLGSSVPQLIMAVTTPRVLDSIRQPRPMPADQFFLQVLSEAQRSGMTLNASARYITIQK